MPQSAGCMRLRLWGWAREHGNQRRHTLLRHDGLLILGATRKIAEHSSRSLLRRVGSRAFAVAHQPDEWLNCSVGSDGRPVVGVARSEDGKGNRRLHLS